MDEEECFYHQVRLIQRRTGCSNHVCNQFVHVFKKFSKNETGRTMASFDKKAKQAAGTNYLVLHGCPKCDKYVYTPKDRNVHCPYPDKAGGVCGHPRFNDENQPWEVLLFLCLCDMCVGFWHEMLAAINLNLKKEKTTFGTMLLLVCIFLSFFLSFFIIFFCFVCLLVFFIIIIVCNLPLFICLLFFLICVQKALYFPLYQRLRSLLRVPGFRGLLEHEYTRPQPGDPNFMYDVYDCPEWKRMMGPPASPCNRIGVQACYDGFQAHNTGSLSIKPVVYEIFSLPPALRFKTEFMLLSMLLPSNAKNVGLKKYFDFSANFELKTLFYTGNNLICFASL